MTYILHVCVLCVCVCIFLYGVCMCGVFVCVVCMCGACDGCVVCVYKYVCLLYLCVHVCMWGDVCLCMFSQAFLKEAVFVNILTPGNSASYLY